MIRVRRELRNWVRSGRSNANPKALAKMCPEFTKDVRDGTADLDSLFKDTEDAAPDVWKKAAIQLSDGLDIIRRTCWECLKEPPAESPNVQICGRCRAACYCSKNCKPPLRSLSILFSDCFLFNLKMQAKKRPGAMAISMHARILRFFMQRTVRTIDALTKP